MYNTKRQYYNALKAQLDLDRVSFFNQWRDLGDFMLPTRPRFQTTDTNRGDRKNRKIVDSTATLALRTLRSGMMSGVTSPARPWFRLTTPDPSLSEVGAVKAWLSDVTDRMSTVFLRSNLYNALPIVYGDIGGFGTSAMMVEEDFKDVVRFYVFPIGSYWISSSSRRTVDGFIREFRMTVRNIVEMFAKKDDNGRVIDWSNISNAVKDCYEQQRFEEWIEVRHVIYPNLKADTSKKEGRFKRYTSCYYEIGSASFNARNYLTAIDDDKYLRESGYDFFPVLVPRWEVNGEDVWATDCPGMTAIGDVKALQTMHKRKAQAIEKMVNPPMTAPASMKTTKTSILPGDVTYVDERSQQGFKPAHEVNPRIQELMLDIQDHQQRIRRVFFEDLFLMLATSDRRDITAREIDERHEEKLLALGPVLEQLNQDLLDPLIDAVFDIMLRQGLIPTPPEELHGVPLKVEYESIMAQAQKLVSIGGIERFAGFAAQVAQVKPEAIDKVNVDQMLDVYADITSVAPGIIRTDEEVEAIRAQRAKAQQAQMAAQTVEQGAGAARDLSQADMSGNNALTQLLQQSQAGNVIPVQ